MINSFNWFNLSTKSLTAIAMAALHDEGLLDYETRFSFFVIDWLTTFIGSFPFSESNGPWLSISEKASAWMQVVFLLGNENRGHVNKPPFSDQESKCYMLFPIQDLRLLAGVWSKRQGGNDSGRSDETWGGPGSIWYQVSLQGPWYQGNVRKVWHIYMVHTYIHTDTGVDWRKVNYYQAQVQSQILNPKSRGKGMGLGLTI